MSRVFAVTGIFWYSFAGICGLCNTLLREKIKIVFVHRRKVCLKGLTFETICCNIQKDVCCNAFVTVSVAVF